MIEHLSEDQVELYRSRSLPAESIVSISDHLISCDRCFERVRQGEPPEEWVTIRLEEADEEQAAGPEVLSPSTERAHDMYYRQMERYVDGEMSEPERSRFELHLSRCDLCRNEVADLLEVKATMAAAADESDRSKVNLVSGEPAVQPAAALSWYRRPVPIWGGIAAALLLALLISVAVNAPLWKEVRRLRELIGKLEKETARMQDQAKGEAEDLRGRLKELEDRAIGEADGGIDDRIASGGPVTLHDGSRIIELNQGELRGLEPVRVNSQQAVARALESSRVEVPRLGMLASKPSTLMSQGQGSALFSLREPLGIVVEEERPLFGWTAAPGAVSYTVVITGVKTHGLFKSPQVRETQWRATEPLPRGEIYTWEVQATLDDGRETSAPAPPAPVAKFKVLGAADAKGIREARRMRPQSHLLLGVLYGQAGLVGAAKQELQALMEENPGSEVARRLLRSVESKVHR